VKEERGKGYANLLRVKDSNTIDFNTKDFNTII
jgi:hypothetical protein